ncbi:MAG: aminotransferase class IV [Planctomycetales bacterium]|nr:aminotransferase class IV [Planctomycetales bacterium]
MATAYFNGEWIDDANIAIPVGDLGFAMGVAVTERLRTFNHRPYRQEEHLHRMRRSLEIVGMEAESLCEELNGAIDAFVERNRGEFREGDDWAVVVFATPGAGSGPTRCVHGFPLPFVDWASHYETGVSLQVSDFRQTPASCWPPELKCRSRMHYYLADQQARSIEPGARALVLDQDGFVGEASTANVLVYRRDEGLVSPRMEKVLPGVSVAVVKEIAERLSLPFVERDLTVEEFMAADEAMLSSTSVCTLPVVRCNGCAIASGAPGEVYRAILGAWNDLAGLDIAAQARAQARSGA